MLNEQIRVDQRHGVQHLAIKIISAEAAHADALPSLSPQPTHKVAVRIEIELLLIIDAFQRSLSSLEQFLAI